MSRNWSHVFVIILVPIVRSYKSYAHRKGYMRLYQSRSIQKPSCFLKTKEKDQEKLSSKDFGLYIAKLNKG